MEPQAHDSFTAIAMHTEKENIYIYIYFFLNCPTDLLSNKMYFFIYSAEHDENIHLFLFFILNSASIVYPSLVEQELF